MMFVGAQVNLPRLQYLPPNATRIDLAIARITVPAVHLRPAAATLQPAILFAHGNAESVAGLIDEFEPWTHEGFHVFLVEYPGYAGATGEPTAETIDATWLTAWDALRHTPGVDATRIVLMGRSLGSGPTARLAALRRPAAVVLLSPFATTADFARARAVPAFLVRDRWDNVDALRRAKVPVLIAHGRRDEVIPPSHAAVLGRLPDVVLDWHDCGHNDCPWDSPAWRSRVLGFLARHGIESAQADRSMPD
jgi:pimeloyl-ACP methyl ester carboxylesterase